MEPGSTSGVWIPGLICALLPRTFSIATRMDLRFMQEELKGDCSSVQQRRAALSCNCWQERHRITHTQWDVKVTSPGGQPKEAQISSGGPDQEQGKIGLTAPEETPQRVSAEISQQGSTGQGDQGLTVHEDRANLIVRQEIPAFESWTRMSQQKGRPVWSWT